MRITRLYFPDSFHENQTIKLNKELSHRLNNVLRVQKGDILFLFDGQGKESRGVIEAIEKQVVIVVVQEFITPITESPLQIHLGQVVSRGERMDFTIQKAVELGVTKITPLLSEYSQVKLPKDRWQKRKEHWKGIIISACEQSGRAVLPMLSELTTLTEWAEQCNEATKVILHPHAENKVDMQAIAKADNIALMIGSEGGFSELEVLLAIKAGFATWQLGPRILRTETAGLAAISILQWQCGDL